MHTYVLYKRRPVRKLYLYLHQGLIHIARTMDIDEIDFCIDNNYRLLPDVQDAKERLENDIYVQHTRRRRKSLDVSTVHLSLEKVARVIEAVRSDLSLTSLVMTHCNIKNEGSCLLSKMLKENKSLTSVNLTRNGIGTSGIGEIAAVLQTNDNLKCLNLTSNCIGDDNAILIIEALKGNKSLTYINLSVNNITDQGAITLVKNIPDDCALTRINLQYNTISVGGQQKILDVVRERNSKIQIDIACQFPGK